MAELTAAVAASTPVALPVTPIVALDVASAQEARVLVDALGGQCGFYKVGLELFTAVGPSIVEWLRGIGKEVFVDLKLHDIPNTVQGAARSVARHGASLLTVHASGGSDMVRAAVDGAAEVSPTCGILGVTILTSLDGAAVGTAWGRPPVTVEAEVLRLTGLLAAGGGAGIVCSGHEAAAVRGAFGDRVGLLIPGIRMAGGAAHDQRRVMTPRAAAEAGARWLILGRAVTGAADPAAAMAAVWAELA
jgi:orotidine-5'-phosphate decarboxylase